MTLFSKRNKYSNLERAVLLFGVPPSWGTDEINRFLEQYQTSLVRSRYQLAYAFPLRWVPGFSVLDCFYSWLSTNMVDIVILADLNNWNGSLSELAGILDMCNKRKIVFLLCNPYVDSSRIPEGMLSSWTHELIGILDREKERQTLLRSQRARAGVKKAQKKGTQLGRPRKRKKKE